MKKVIVVGSNHAGTYAQYTLLDNYKDNVEVTAYDANSNIPFLGCGIALWVGGVIKQPDGLFYSNPKKLEELGSKIHTEHQVVDVNFKEKTIKVKDLKTGKEFEDNYDDLILAVGSWPIVPRIEGMDLKNIVLTKRYQDAQSAIKLIEQENVNNVVVVGAGYIGIELAEAFHLKGKNVTLITDGEILNKYYDKEFVEEMRNKLTSNGIKVVENERVQKFEGKGKIEKVFTDKGEYEADAAMISVGIHANTKFLKDSELKMNERGVIEVNASQETNIPNVYAVGDCATIVSNVMGKGQHIGLATNAVRTGIIAGHNIGGTKLNMKGVQGSNAISILGLAMTSTGITEEVALALGMDVDSVTIEDNIRPDFMPTNNKVKIKVLWDKKTLKILGAQIMSEEDITLAIHTFSLALEVGYTIDKLATLDLFFLPHFNKPDNFITKAGLAALSKIL